MNSELRIKVVWSVSILVLLVGLGMTVKTVRTAPDRIRQIERKVDDLARLAEMHEQDSALDETLRQLKESSEVLPGSIRDATARVLPGIDASIRTGKPPPAVPGWVVRRQVVVLNRVALADLGRFMHELESQRPPWRITECTVSSSERGEGIGDVTLVLDALEKKGP